MSQSRARVWPGSSLPRVPVAGAAAFLAASLAPPGSSWHGLQDRLSQVRCPWSEPVSARSPVAAPYLWSGLPQSSFRRFCGVLRVICNPLIEPPSPPRPAASSEACEAPSLLALSAPRTQPGCPHALSRVAVATFVSPSARAWARAASRRLLTGKASSDRSALPQLGIAFLSCLMAGRSRLQALLSRLRRLQPSTSVVPACCKLPTPIMGVGPWMRRPGRGLGQRTIGGSWPGRFLAVEGRPHSRHGRSPLNGPSSVGG